MKRALVNFSLRSVDIVILKQILRDAEARRRQVGEIIGEVKFTNTTENVCVFFLLVPNYLVLQM